MSKDLDKDEFGLIETTYGKASQSHSVYFNDEVVDIDKYHSFMHLLRTATDKDNITLILQNYGGSCHTCLAIGNLMRACKANIDVEVIAPCYSAGTTIALAGDSLVLHNHTFLMFHDYSGGYSGKGNEIKLHVEATEKFIRGYMKEFHMPFLTLNEHKSMVAGMDLYIHASDRDIKKRIKRHFR